VLDTDTRETLVYWMTAVGTRVALQAIFATLVSGKYLEMRVGGESARMYELGSRYHPKSPGKGKMHATYKRMPSGGSAVTIYSDFARADEPGSDMDPSVLLLRPGEDKVQATFEF